MRTRRVLRLLERTLFLAGVALLGYWASVQVSSQLTRRHVLDAMAAPVAEMEASLREIVTQTGFVGRIEIPRIGLDEVVLADADDRSLDLGAGHLSRTALPDEPGNFVLAGHRDSHFRKLRDIRPGDAIRVTTPLGTFEYQVEETFKVLPDQVGVLEDLGMPMLTLVTCYPFEYVGPAPQRFIVRARPVSSWTTAAVALPGLPRILTGNRGATDRSP
jgi:sortase A